MTSAIDEEECKYADKCYINRIYLADCPAHNGKNTLDCRVYKHLEEEEKEVREYAHRLIKYQRLIEN